MHFIKIGRHVFDLHKLERARFELDDNEEPKIELHFASGSFFFEGQRAGELWLALDDLCKDEFTHEYES